MRNSAFITFALFLAILVNANAAVLYVDANCATPAPPYSSWDTAATNIQDAVNLTSDGDLVLVTNGVYSNSYNLYPAYSRVAVTNAIVVQSVNGATSTVIDGSGSWRCAYLGGHAKLVGLTLTNGLADAGTGGLGGRGAGVYGNGNEVLVNCVLAGNKSITTVSGGNLGEGAGAYSVTLSNCIVVSNSTFASGGGAASSRLYNCLISGNTASQAGGGTYQGSNFNCTISGNSALTLGGGSAFSLLWNCLFYKNSAMSSPNVLPGGVILNTCASPLQPGNGNLDADPQMASLSRLSAGSPCIGAGSLSFVGGTDLDGNPWGNPPTMGCYEWLPGSFNGPLSVGIAARQTNCAVGFNDSFTALISGNVAASRWDFGDGTVVSNQPIITHTWLNPGPYPVVLSAWNDSHPAGISATALVQVVTQPVHYVAFNSPSPAAPYTSWSSAAHSIQPAVDAATVPGALIIVSNGLYNVGSVVTGFGIASRVAVTNPVIVRSANGPGVTVIQGSKDATSTGEGANAIRGVYLVRGAVLDGFTVTNGATYFYSGTSVVQNGGGGVYSESSEGVVTNCVVARNIAGQGGGVVGATVYNSLIASNASPDGYGGGASYATLNQCTFKTNYAYYEGGGAFYGLLNNSLVVSNIAQNKGGGASRATVLNCTFVGNTGSDGGGIADGFAANSIFFYNSAFVTTSNWFSSSGLTMMSCCTPSQTGFPFGSRNNFSSTPNFVNLASGDFHVQSTSPCINGGDNTYVTVSTDFGGQPRMAGPTVDVGAYEYQSPSSVLPYFWAQRYGLPTDGSADFVDSDGDGMNNWQESRASTIPTNAASVLSMVTVTNGATGLLVRWQSVLSRIYYLQRATNLSLPNPFRTIGTNLGGATVSPSTFVDTAATNAGPFFYRVGVQ
jgi:hypothetical protein